MPPKTRGAKTKQAFTTDKGESSGTGVTRRNTRVQEKEEDATTRRRGRVNQEEKKNVQFENMVGHDRHTKQKVDKKMTSEDKYRGLMDRPVEHNKYIDETALVTIGISEEVHEFINRIGWSTFVGIREPTYKHLLCEFLNTIAFEKYRAMDPNWPNTIKFTLGGRQYSMTTSQFGVACGLYTEEEIQSEDYKTSLVTFPPGITAFRAWRIVSPTGDDWDARYTKNTKLPTPTLRYMHRYITYTINGRGDSNRSVTKDDLFYLWCMVEGRKCNMAFFLAKYLHHKSNCSHGSICGGTYVTRLARNLGLLDHIPRNAELQNMQPLTISTLIKMRLIVRDSNSRFKFVGDIEDQVPDVEAVDIPDMAAPLLASSEPPAPHRHISDRLQTLEDGMSRMSNTLEDMVHRQKRIERALMSFYSHNNILYPSSSSDSEPNA